MARRATLLTMILDPDALLPQGPQRWTTEAVGQAWAECRRQLRAALQDPAVLTVAAMVGVPGSGKSAWAREHDQPGLVIFDACWTRPGHRAALARQIRQAGRAAVAVLVRCPLDVCRDRNALRPPGRRVPDVALTRAYLALRERPPTLAEGWSRVLVQDGQARRIQDAKVTPEQQLERTAQIPATAAWKILQAKVLPKLREIEPGEGIPASVAAELKAMERSLLRASDNRVRKALFETGKKIEQRQREAWDKQVASVTGKPWKSPETPGFTDWYKDQQARVIGIRERIVPGIREAIEQSRAKGQTAAELEAEWKDNGLPLEGYGTAEGRGKAAATEAAGELNQQATRAAQEAAGAEWYEWGPTTSKKPDPEHASRRGKRFQWSNAPQDGHPGDRPGCHCRPVPVLTAEDVERLKGKEKAPAKPKAPKPKAIAAKAAPAPKPVKAPAPKAAPKPAAPEPAAKKARPKAIRKPASWAVARELEARAMRGLSPAQQEELRELAKRDEPVLDPGGSVVSTKGTGAAAKKWKKSLSKEQVEAISDWSGSGFTRMRAIDGGVIGRRKEVIDSMTPTQYLAARKRIVAIREAMADAPRHDGALYRGLSLPASVPETAAYLKQLTTVGNEFQLESISSWTHNRNVAKNVFSDDEPDNVIVRIKKSTRGVPINAAGLSNYGEGEGEVIVDKGSRYRVVSVKKEEGDYDRQVIEIEEI